ARIRDIFGTGPSRRRADAAGDAALGHALRRWPPVFGAGAAEPGPYLRRQRREIRGEDRGYRVAPWSRRRGRPRRGRRLTQGGGGACPSIQPHVVGAGTGVRDSRRGRRAALSAGSSVNALEIDGVWKYYGDFAALRDIAIRTEP